MVTLNEIMNKAKKKYSPGTFTKGSDCKVDYKRIPTGVFALDYMLGGGFPMGVTSSIYGPPGGGKTLVMTRVACGAQNLCFNCHKYLWECVCDKQLKRNVVIVQTETFDIGWAIQLGLDPERVVIVEADSGEEASDIIADCLRADDCGVVLLDSLPMLTPIKELEGSALDDRVALQARLISEMIRRIKTLLIKEKKRVHLVSFITTNQVRAKIGGSGFGFGVKEEQPGGFTSKHDWHVSLRMSQLKSPNIDKETELPIDARFKASMVAMGNKRKIFTLAGSSEFFVTVTEGGEYLKGTINDYKTVFRYADAAGLIGREPWSFWGETFEKKQDIMDDWLDTKKFLSAKRFVVSDYIEKTKEVVCTEDADA